MENLITLVVIIITIVSVINNIKKKSMDQLKTKPSGSGGWIARLNAYLEDLQKKIEQQSGATPSGERQWEQLAGGDKVKRAPETIDEDIFFEYPDEPPPVPPPVKASLPKKRAKKAVPEIKPQPKGVAVQTCATRKVASRARLRQAVVWAEILGPPVALRDPSGDRR